MRAREVAELGRGLNCWRLRIELGGCGLCWGRLRIAPPAPVPLRIEFWQLPTGTVVRWAPAPGAIAPTPGAFGISMLGLKPLAG